LDPATPVHVSFDIDGLASSEAGGCSQSWATGLKLQDYLHFFHLLKQRSRVQGLGLYEVSPPLDFDQRSSKAAAQIIYHFLFQDEL
jgi:formiminoglutamase